MIIETIKGRTLEEIDQKINRYIKRGYALQRKKLFLLHNG
jgi:hypothetical protein